MTIAITGESCFNDIAKLIVRDTLYPSLSCAKLSFNQPNIGFLHLRRRAMSLATSSTGPPDLRLTTPYRYTTHANPTPAQHDAQGQFNAPMYRSDSP